MAYRVALDTHILIWGIKEQAEIGQEEKITKAKTFIKRLEEEKAKIFVPSIVLAEIMCKVPNDERPEILSRFSRRFAITSFDFQAALKYGELWLTSHSNNSFQETQENNCKRDCIKADLMIIASALCSQVTTIFSEDADLTRLANGIIPVQSIPDISEQLRLFEHEE